MILKVRDDGVGVCNHGRESVKKRVKKGLLCMHVIQVYVEYKYICNVNVHNVYVCLVHVLI